jgi:hypothetical protein
VSRWRRVKGLSHMHVFIAGASSMRFSPSLKSHARTTP